MRKLFVWVLLNIDGNKEKPNIVGKNAKAFKIN
jgi:hypothetical protein